MMTDFKVADLIRPTDKLWFDNKDRTEVGNDFDHSQIGEIIAISLVLYTIWWPAIRKTTKHFEDELQRA